VGMALDVSLSCRAKVERWELVLAIDSDVIQKDDLKRHAIALVFNGNKNPDEGRSHLPV
jgi:hypothetical protein